MTTIGDRFKSTLNGHVYEVKSVKGTRILLESEDGKSQLLTEKEILKLFYDKVENATLQKNLIPSLKQGHIPFFLTSTKKRNLMLNYGTNCKDSRSRVSPSHR